MDTREWHLKRNCSLSPRQLAAVYALIATTSLAVALMFLFLYGAWQILTFAFLELTGVAFAFLSYARHATDHEHIALMENCLLVERVLAGETEQTRLDPQWTRIIGPESGSHLVELEARGVHVRVGRFVTEAVRHRLAKELNQALRTHLFASAGARVG